MIHLKHSLIMKDKYQVWIMLKYNYILKLKYSNVIISGSWDNKLMLWNLN